MQERLQSGRTCLELDKAAQLKKKKKKGAYNHQGVCIFAKSA